MTRSRPTPAVTPGSAGRLVAMLSFEGTACVTALRPSMSTRRSPSAAKHPGKSVVVSPNHAVRSPAGAITAPASVAGTSRTPAMVLGRTSRKTFEVKAAPFFVKAWAMTLTGSSERQTGIEAVQSPFSPRTAATCNQHRATSGRRPRETRICRSAALSAFTTAISPPSSEVARSIPGSAPAGGASDLSSPSIQSIAAWTLPRSRLWFRLGA